MATGVEVIVAPKSIGVKRQEGTAFKGLNLEAKAGLPPRAAEGRNVVS